MTWYEILIIAAAAAFVLGVAAWQLLRRLRGKGGCDCGCSSCSGCSACNSQKQPKQ